MIILPKLAKHISPVVIAVLVVFLIGISLSAYPIQSILWHCCHGSEVSFGEAAVTLPLLWWRASDDNEAHVIQHAMFASTSASRITIFPLRGKVIQTEAAALVWQRAYLDGLSANERRRFAPVTISAHERNIYCVRDMWFPSDNRLICRVPGSPWGCSYDGSAAEEMQAESILMSLHSSE